MSRTYCVDGRTVIVPEGGRLTRYGAVEYADDRGAPGANIFPPRWLKRGGPAPQNEVELTAWINVNIAEDRASGLSSPGRKSGKQLLAEHLRTPKDPWARP